jgi:hypothetical protein
MEDVQGSYTQRLCLRTYKTRTCLTAYASSHSISTSGASCPLLNAKFRVQLRLHMILSLVAFETPHNHGRVVELIFDVRAESSNIAEYVFRVANDKL